MQLTTLALTAAVSLATITGCHGGNPGVRPAKPVAPAGPAPNDAPIETFDTFGAVVHPAATPVERGRYWTAVFFAGDTERFWAKLDDEMRSLFGDKDGVDRFRGRVDTVDGREKQILSEAARTKGKYIVYERRAIFEKTEGPVVIGISFEGPKIAGFWVKADPSPAATTKLDYVPHASLRLPFAGTWSVAWGGRRVEDNAHVVSRSQRFAYDFLVTEGDETHRGEGTRNEDYYCYGRPILSPAAGIVVVAVDGLPDNVPGKADAEHLAGNHVMIDHGHDEYSLLAHLKPTSVAVKVGDAVKVGQALGACGNSGNSSEPHLHFHLQNTPRPLDGEGLPAPFEGYAANGKAVARSEPKKGQAIRAIVPSPAPGGGA